MARVKRGVTSHAKHKKILKAAKGYYGRRKNTIRIAKQAVEKANQYAYRDRKNAQAHVPRAVDPAPQCGGARRSASPTADLSTASPRPGSTVDRKVLSDLAIREPAAFQAIVEKAKAALRRSLHATNDRPGLCAGAWRRYNRWQNENLYGVADRLSDEERRRERGAFFGSIHKTLSHLLWADRIWMSRFADLPRAPGGIPQSVSLYPGLGGAARERDAIDATIIGWADGSSRGVARRRSDLVFRGREARDITKPTWVLVTHFFNHQTHHRGQVHCMLTQAGGKPHDTDLRHAGVTRWPISTRSNKN